MASRLIAKCSCGKYPCSWRGSRKVDNKGPHYCELKCKKDWRGRPVECGRKMKVKSFTSLFG